MIINFKRISDYRWSAREFHIQVDDVTCASISDGGHIKVKASDKPHKIRVVVGNKEYPAIFVTGKNDVENVVIQVIKGQPVAKLADAIEIESSTKNMPNGGDDRSAGSAIGTLLIIIGIIIWLLVMGIHPVVWFEIRPM